LPNWYVHVIYSNQLYLFQQARTLSLEHLTALLVQPAIHVLVLALSLQLVQLGNTVLRGMQFAINALQAHTVHVRIAHLLFVQKAHMRLLDRQFVRTAQQVHVVHQQLQALRYVQSVDIWINICRLVHLVHILWQMPLLAQSALLVSRVQTQTNCQYPVLLDRIATLIQLHVSGALLDMYDLQCVLVDDVLIMLGMSDSKRDSCCLFARIICCWFSGELYSVSSWYTMRSNIDFLYFFRICLFISYIIGNDSVRTW